MSSLRSYNNNNNNNKLYYQNKKKKKLTLQYNMLIQKKVMFTQDNLKANRAE